MLDGQQARLTQAALETLAVVAYKQPVSRARVSAIRGVNVDGVMRTLLTRGLVEEAGQDDETGANLYRTTSYFLERIGVTSIDDLPELAPYLPDMDDIEDELAGARRRAHRARADARAAPEPARARRASTDARRGDGTEPDGGTERVTIATDDDGLVRLQKLLAQSGVASRRKCEELMLDGLVEVDGEVVTRLGTKVDPTRRGDPGRRQAAAADLARTSTSRSTSPAASSRRCPTPRAGRTLADLVADRPERLFHVGRLDTDTSGLLLLTNDGDFAQRMAHPSYEVDKTYVAEVDGEVTKATVSGSCDGVTLDDGPVTVSQARIMSVRPGQRERQSIVELVIHEGRNRIVRRLLEQLGHPVRRLTRTAIGPVKLGRAPVRRAARPDPRRARRAAGQRPALSPSGPARVLARRRTGDRRGRGGRRGGASGPGRDPARGRTRATTCSSGSPRWCST